MQKLIRELIEESIKVKKDVLSGLCDDIEKAANAVTASIKSGGKVLVFGNGGSAADSQHFAAELVGRFRKERKALPAIALTVNTSTMTAMANDYSFDKIFAREVEALGRRGDIAVAISTSGNSKNVIEAVKKAKDLGIRTIGLLGCGGGKLKELCDLPLVVGSDCTPRVQEAHIMIIHIICQLVEDSI